MSDVAERSDPLLRVIRNPCLFCSRDTSVCCIKAQAQIRAHPVCFWVDPIVEPDVLTTSESSQDRLCRSVAKCDTHRELLHQ